MMKTILLIAAAFVCAVSVRAETPVDNPACKVGLILPLSGPLAEYGIAFQNGVTLAQAEQPAISRDCTFAIEDSKYDPKTAVSALQKLVSSDGIHLVYNWGGPTSDALAPLAERLPVALFVWSADPKVSEGRSRVIRFADSGLDYGVVLARALAARGMKKLQVVRTENQYLDSILDGLRASLTPQMSVEVIDSYQPADQDFRSTIAKLRAKRGDALGVFMLSGQVSSFLAQLKEQGLQIPIFGTDFFESGTEVRNSRGGMEGAIFANNEVTPAFRSAYVARFKNDLQINHAANGYDFAAYLCRDVRAAIPDGSASDVLAYTATRSLFEGAQGSAPFITSPKGDKYFRFPVVVRKVKGDSIVTEPG